MRMSPGQTGSYTVNLNVLKQGVLEAQTNTRVTLTKMCGFNTLVCSSVTLLFYVNTPKYHFSALKLHRGVLNHKF